MKRVISLLTVLFLLLGTVALTEAAPAQPLTADELANWTKGILQRAIKDGLSVEKEGDENLVIGVGYRLSILEDALSEDSHVLYAVLNVDSVHVDGLMDPRKVSVADHVNAVYAAYPNDNQQLVGTPDEAILSIDGDLPGLVTYGKVTREGQDIRLIEQGLLKSDGDQVYQMGIQYTIQQGMVETIRYYAPATPMSAEEAEAMLHSLREKQEKSDYASYLSEKPASLQREDLNVQGLDFLGMTPEDAKATFGAPLSEEKLPDSTGDQFLAMQWEGLEIIFLMDKDGNLKRADRITVQGEGIEGPRGLRVGNLLEDAVKRFDHGEGGVPLESATLYGDPERATPPYGFMVKEGEDTKLYYAVEENGQKILLVCRFLDIHLVEMTLSYD